MNRCRATLIGRRASTDPSEISRCTPSTTPVPITISDAVADLAEDDAKALAGGKTLLPTMKQRLASPTALIDLGGLAELSGIRREGDAIVIGAMTRHADVATSDVVKSAIPALAALAGGIGDPAVRNRGTIGGSLANNDPPPTIPPARWRSARRSSQTNARSPPTTILRACSRPRLKRAS